MQVWVSSPDPPPQPPSSSAASSSGHQPFLALPTLLLFPISLKLPIGALRENTRGADQAHPTSSADVGCSARLGESQGCPATLLRGANASQNTLPIPSRRGQPSAPSPHGPHDGPARGG